jgi:hypothetical protein
MDGQPRGDNGGGYGNNNPRGVEGGFGSAAADQAYQDRLKQCNCGVDYNMPQTVTVEDPSWNGELGLVGPVPAGKVTFQSEKRTTVYGRSNRGMTSAGGRCSTCGGINNGGK